MHLREVLYSLTSMLLHLERLKVRAKNMASGFGTRGGPGRCHSFWVDFSQCMVGDVGLFSCAIFGSKLAPCCAIERFTSIGFWFLRVVTCRRSDTLQTQTRRLLWMSSSQERGECCCCLGSDRPMIRLCCKSRSRSNRWFCILVRATKPYHEGEISRRACATGRAQHWDTDTSFNEMTEVCTVAPLLWLVEIYLCTLCCGLLCIHDV